MLGFATYAALLPALRDEWRLSNTEAGLIGSAFFLGYIATVSYWTALTDRVDGRKVYLAGSVLAVAGEAGFGGFGNVGGFPAGAPAEAGEGFVGGERFHSLNGAPGA